MFSAVVLSPNVLENRYSAFSTVAATIPRCHLPEKSSVLAPLDAKLALFLLALPSLSQPFPTWCGKHYLPGAPLTPSPFSSRFPIPSLSPTPLLDFRCAPSVRPFIVGDTGSVLLDLAVKNEVGVPWEGGEEVEVELWIGDTRVGGGRVRADETGEMGIEWTGLEGRREAYELGCVARSEGGRYGSESRVHQGPQEPTALVHCRRARWPQRSSPRDADCIRPCQLAGSFFIPFRSFVFYGTASLNARADLSFAGPRLRRFRVVLVLRRRRYRARRSLPAVQQPHLFQAIQHDLQPRLWLLRYVLFSSPRILAHPFGGCDNCVGSATDVSTRLDKSFDRIRWSGRSRSLTVWETLQAFDGTEEFWSGTPTGQEYLAMAVLAINHGATGSSTFPSTVLR